MVDRDCAGLGDLVDDAGYHRYGCHILCVHFPASVRGFMKFVA